MIIRKLTLVILFAGSFVFAQSIKVTETKKIPINIVSEAYYPRFSMDDSKILFSTTGYKGLYSFDKNSNQFSTISELYGAGYNPLILDTENIVYGTFKINNGKKLHTIRSFGLRTGKRTVIEAEKRYIKMPNQLPSKEILLVEESGLQKRISNSTTLAKSNAKTKAVYVENNNLILVNGEISKVLNPLGKGVYVWESISKDGNRILFSYGNKGAYVCDLDGNILENIEEAHFPRFSPNGKFISYMIDKDNGYSYTSSDLYIYSEELGKSFPITNTRDKIEMFAEWSNDGNQLVYHTTKGEIFIAALRFDN